LLTTSVLAAIREEDEKRIRSSAPRAISALSRLIETPSHRDHARGIAMVLDRVHPAETQHTVKVQHDATPAAPSGCAGITSWCPISRATER
jgi:hypothetical protein